ncbi:MAG: hypothetical protein EBR82_21110 [Caulobacteraceae bacterium]|nr:hypothetical protein [Caulobacteraceae bacterium]
METQDKKFVIAYSDQNDGIDLEIIYGKNELDAMLYFLDNSDIDAITWSSPAQLQDWIWDEWGAIINYIEV